MGEAREGPVVDLLCTPKRLRDGDEPGPPGPLETAPRKVPDAGSGSGSQADFANIPFRHAVMRPVTAEAATV